jgi:hypothetical protein
MRGGNLSVILWYVTMSYIQKNIENIKGNSQGRCIYMDNGNMESHTNTNREYKQRRTRTEVVASSDDDSEVSETVREGCEEVRVCEKFELSRSSKNTRSSRNARFEEVRKIMFGEIRRTRAR